MSKLDYDDNEERVEINNPSPQQIVECLKSRGKKCDTYAQLFGSQTYSNGANVHHLGFLRTRSDALRFEVMYYHHKDDRYEIQVLIDKRYEADDRILPVFLDNGESSQVLLRETVDIETAISVACYFLEHDAIPTDLTWQPTHL